jgi:hypothetical protein
MSLASTHSTRLLVAVVAAVLAAGCATSRTRADEEANAKRARSHYDIGVDHLTTAAPRWACASSWRRPRSRAQCAVLTRAGRGLPAEGEVRRGRACICGARSRSRPIPRCAFQSLRAPARARASRRRGRGGTALLDPTFPALAGALEPRLGRIQAGSPGGGTRDVRPHAEVQPRLLARAAQPRHPRIRAGPPSGSDPALRGGARAAAGPGSRSRSQFPTGRDLRLARQAEPRRRISDGGGREGAERSMGQEIRGSPEAAAERRGVRDGSIGATSRGSAAARSLGRRAREPDPIPAARSSGLEAGAFDAPDGFVRALSEPWPRRSGSIPTTP